MSRLLFALVDGGWVVQFDLARQCRAAARRPLDREWFVEEHVTMQAVRERMGWWRSLWGVL